MDKRNRNDRNIAKHQYLVTNDHHCHWPGCNELVPAARWGCRRHWFMLPYKLRDRISASYRPGQEISKTPSAAYLEAAKAVRDWIIAEADEALALAIDVVRSHPCRFPPRRGR
jgi:hypothetical protein